MYWKIIFNITTKLVKDNVENYVGDIDNLKGIKFRDFRELCIRQKFQNFKIAKLNTRQINYMSSLRFSFS